MRYRHFTPRERRERREYRERQEREQRRTMEEQGLIRSAYDRDCIGDPDEDSRNQGVGGPPYG